MATEGPRPGETYNDWVRRMAAKERAEGTLGPPTPPPLPEPIKEGPQSGETYNEWVRRMAAQERAAQAPAPPPEEPRWRLVGAAGTGAVEAPPPTLEQLKAEAGLVETAQAEVQSRAAQLQGYLDWRAGPQSLTLREYLERPSLITDPSLSYMYQQKYEEYRRFYEEEYEPTHERYLGGYGRYESAYRAFTHVQDSMAAAEAGVMRGLVTGALETKVPAWARIWESTKPIEIKPLDTSRIQASFLGSAVPSQEMIARQHLKNLVSSIMGLPISRGEKIKHIRMGILKPSEIWQPPLSMVPAEAEKYFGGMPPKWYLGEAPTPGELQLQKAFERVGESLAYSGTVWYGVKESLLGKIPLFGDIAVGYVKAAEPWGKALSELIVSIKEGGPLLTGKVPILHEGKVFTTGLDFTVAEQLGYVPGGFPVPKQPGLISLETLGGAIFYAGLFAGATKTAKLGVKSATYGFKVGARGTGIITKPLRAVTQRIGPAAESELVYLEYQLAKASASVKGALRGIFTTEPFYYYPRIGPAGQPTLTPMYRALDAMKRRLGIPKLPTIVSRAGPPGKLAQYRLGGLVKYEYVKPAPSITSYWDVPIKKFGGVSPLPSELVWVRDSARVFDQLKMIIEPGGKLADVQYWYKLIPTGKVKPIPYWDYMQSLRKALGQTVSTTRLSGFEVTVGKKVGTGYYWSLERLGVPPAEKAVGWFGVKTRGEIFPGTVGRAGPSKFVFDEQLIKWAAMFKKDKAVISFLKGKIETPIMGGGRGYIDKLTSWAKGERFAVRVHPGPEAADSALGRLFSRSGEQLLLMRSPELETAWSGAWMFPVEETGAAWAVSAGLGGLISSITGTGARPKAPTRVGMEVGKVPRIKDIPLVSIFQPSGMGVGIGTGAGVAHAQAVAQIQMQVQAQMQAQTQQMSQATSTLFVFPYGEEKKTPIHRQKVKVARFRPLERVWPVGRIERLFEVQKPKMPKVKIEAPKVKVSKSKDAFDARKLKEMFKLPKTKRG